MKLWLLCATCLLSSGMAFSWPEDEAAQPKLWELTPSLAYSRTAYKHGDIERQLLGLAFERSMDVLGGLSLAGEFGYAFKTRHDAMARQTEWAKWNGEGSGYVVGGETKLAPFRNLSGLKGWARLHYWSEHYGDRDFVPSSTDADAFGLILGALYDVALTPSFGLRAGVELVVFEDGSFDPRVGNNTIDVVGDKIVEKDVKRDNPFGLRVGGVYETKENGLRIKADVVFLSELSVRLGVGFPF